MTLQRKTPLKRTCFTKKTERPTLQQMKSSGLVQKASYFTQKPRKKLKPRAANNAGWYRWAVENIWIKRDRKCEVCGWSMDFIGDEPYPSVFSHLLPRGSYRKYKTDERNVIIKCPNCHNMWHRIGPTHLQEDKEWAAVCARYFALRNEANGLTQRP